jgi:ferredoxin-fold anticodon binding domain-containing protein
MRRDNGNIRDKLLSLEGETVVIIPKEDADDGILAEVIKVDKITSTVKIITIGPPGQNNKEEILSIDKVEDAWRVSED